MVARTIAKQFAEQAEGATHPFQYALSTRAGTECVARIVQALTRMDENATLLSIDGVGAHDSISRRAMFRGLADMVDGEKIIPFVRQLNDSPSTFLWEDDTGGVRRVWQGEGGEQGDPLMPSLFSLGQHRAMVAVQAQLIEGGRAALRILGRHLCRVFSRQDRADLFVVGRATESEDRHQHPPRKDKVVVCSRVQAGHGRHVDSCSQTKIARSCGLEGWTAEQLRLLEKIPAVENVQAGWLLLSFRAATRSNYWLRTVCPEPNMTGMCGGDWQKFCESETWNVVRLPLRYCR